MRRFILIVLACLLICPLVLAVTTEQQFTDYTKAPFTIDPNQIAIDPNSGKRLCLNDPYGWITRETGKPTVIEAEYYEPEGQQVTINVTSVPPVQISVTVDTTNHKYTMSFTTPRVVGPMYITIACTDIPPNGVEAKTRKGTLVLDIIPLNKPPVLGCGVLRK